jgi:Ca-activated chloride channel family protein
MEQVRLNGEQKELRDEIVELGTRYGIVTPYTSYLALEDERQISRFMSLGQGGAQPVTRRNRSGGISGSADAQAPAAAPSASPDLYMSPTTGAEAVQLSKQARLQQDANSVKDEKKSDNVRRAGGKTFYLIDGVWTDSEFKAESKLPETVLVFGSDEYFALLKQHTRLGSYFSLGERVVVVFEGRVYRVNAPAP